MSMTTNFFFYMSNTSHYNGSTSRGNCNFHSITKVAFSVGSFSLHHFDPVRVHILEIYTYPYKNLHQGLLKFADPSCA